MDFGHQKIVYLQAKADQTFQHLQVIDQRDLLSQQIHIVKY